MRRIRRLTTGPVAVAFASIALLFGLSAIAQEVRRPPGYLGANVPDPLAFIPPPPAAHSAEAAADASAFDRTRQLQGSPRWTLATKDAVQTPVAMLADFECALGVPLTEAKAPRLVHLLTRAGADIGAVVNRAKDNFRRPRPFIVRPGPICVDNRDSIAKSWSYPSGHSTGGWTVALILAELAPDRAGQILARGRAYGESRVVCGVHYVSDVEAGRSNGAGLVAALHANPDFQADVAAARAELAALRESGASPPSGAQCDIQADASARTPW